MKRTDAITGVLLGTAVGDALGLPAEGLPPERIARRWPDGWRMRLVGRRGMISDDTEHALFVAQALLQHPGDVSSFGRSLAWKLRWWFLSLPAGVGLATARACIKLWLGFPPSRSGVFSAGNGPAMRSAILGAYFATDREQRHAYVRASTRLTHTDPKAEFAALAIAEAVAWIARGENQPMDLPALLNCGEGEEWATLCCQLFDSLEKQHSTRDYALSLGLARGVTGYAYHTVPLALYAWLSHLGDFRAALISALDCGGDTDTVGAIVGALAGAATGPSGIPSNWLADIAEWPRSVTLLRQVGARLGAQTKQDCPTKPVRYCWFVIPFRNLLFLIIVLAHGFRRLLPPW